IGTMLSPRSVRPRHRQLGRVQHSARRNRPSFDALESRLVLSDNFGYALDLGGTSSTNATATTADNSGNVYVVGDFQGTTDFDPGTGTYNLTASGTQNAYLAKYNSSGNLVWAGNIPTTAGNSTTVSGITRDSSNNLYVTGDFSGTADFDLGSGTYNLTGGIGGS